MTYEYDDGEYKIIYSINAREEIKLDEVYTPKRRGDILPTLGISERIDLIRQIRDYLQLREDELAKEGEDIYKEEN